MRLRRGILLGLWVVSLIFISFYGGAVSYGLFFGVSLIPLISLIYILCVFFRFRIFQQINSRYIVCRQAVPYYFVLQNEDKYGFASVKTKLFSSLSYVENISEDMEYELLPKDRFTYETRLVCKYRGEYEVGIKEVTITDFFRLFSFKYVLRETIKAQVQPRMIHLEELRSISDFVSVSQNENYFSNTEPDVVVREYMQGDPLKYINWKASAREQKLMTRKRIGEEKQLISIYMDSKRYSKEKLEYLPVENQMLELTLALGLFFVERNISFSMLNGQQAENRVIRNLQEYDALYQSVSAMYFNTEIDSKQQLQKVLEQCMKQQSKILIGVMQDITDEMLVMLEPLLNLGVLIVLYVVTDQDIELLLKKGNERLRIIVVDPNAELKDVL